jgi:predicted enzyme involved in methoxymalonyl-ACP biosynthesis
VIRIQNVVETIRTIVTRMMIKTIKNQQVVDFYEKCGFIKLNESDGDSQYSLQVNSYKNQNIQYIGLRYGR